jgi:hypothetical protein
MARFWVPTVLVLNSTRMVVGVLITRHHMNVTHHQNISRIRHIVNFIVSISYNSERSISVQHFESFCLIVIARSQVGAVTVFGIFDGRELEDREPSIGALISKVKKTEFCLCGCLGRISSIFWLFFVT